MTKTQQDNSAATDAVEPTDTVELNDAALDQAAGGGSDGDRLVGIDYRPTGGFYGTGVYKTTDSGRS